MSDVNPFLALAVIYVAVFACLAVGFSLGMVYGRFRASVEEAKEDAKRVRESTSELADTLEELTGGDDDG